MSDLIYREIVKQHELEMVSDLETLIWQPDDAREPMSPRTLQVIHHVGGGCVGAFDGGRLVAFAFGLPVRGELSLWSHIAAVHPDYQGRGIGYRIKRYQREWAIGQGYERMLWTFDPLMQRNAHFNFHQLRVVCNRYEPNFYGVMNDGLNRGFESDRLVVRWEFEQAPVVVPDAVHEMPYLLSDSDGLPSRDAMPDADWVRVAIPCDGAERKQTELSMMQGWQADLRETLQSAFGDGYMIVDFWRGDGGCAYVLSRAGD